MPKLPVVSGRELVKALQRAGWVVERQRGSHVGLYYPATDSHVSVPVHGSRTLGPGLVAEILQRAGLTADDLRRLLGRR